MLPKIKILTLEINNQSKAEILDEIGSRLDAGQKTFITTPNPEFFYASFWDYHFERVINSADINLPDGIGVIWASYFLSIPFYFHGYYLRVVEGFVMLLFTALEILVNPKRIYRFFKEKITGADFFWDLLALADKRGLKVYFLGAQGNVPELVSKKVKEKFPDLKVAGFSNANPDNQNLVDEINNSGADLLFVAYGQVKQENWIADRLQKLNVKIAMGVGGTFDYVAGTKNEPPRFIREAGLEWLYRLFTQPERIGRIWNATFGFMRGVLRHKVMSQMPYRQNVVGVIINQENKIFLGQRVYRGSWQSPIDIDSPKPAVWQFPQGGVDANEDPDKAILREVWEETGISFDKISIIKKSTAVNQYTWSHGKRELLFNSFKYRGQEQKIYFLKFLGSNDDINLNMPHPEFTNYQWVNTENLLEIVDLYRRPLIEKILPELREITK